MVERILFSIFIFCLVTNGIRTISISKQSHELFQLLKETREIVKHGNECLPPSKYFAGSCYTYIETARAPSWEQAYNNCLSLPMSKDARLSAIESVEEYEFVERELIGLKSGSESVSVYIGLRKTNNTWYWSNDIPLKETPVYRFWVDNNRDILAYDCGIIWLARNTSVITAAPCVEQALRPYVCKQTIDRCYNHSGTCGKYGKCINLPSMNSSRCRCRFFYTGDQCEKWSNQGLQVIISGVIVLIAFMVLYVINIDRSDNSWSFRKSTFEQYQSPKLIDDFVDNKKQHWHSSSSRLDEHKKFSIKYRKLIEILLSIILTIIICIIIFTLRDYTQVHSTGLVQFCALYENYFYHHLLTLPIAFVIILIIIVNQTRKEYYRSNKEKFSIFIPIPFNPFSKINRFDTMILCGIISHEVLEIITAIFRMTINGPLFDLIRQIGFIIIVGLRYYPIYSVIEMSNANILYLVLCAFYMWLDLILRIIEQVFCVKINSLIRIWQKFNVKYQASSIISTTTMLMPEYETSRPGRFHRIKDRFSFRATKSIVAATTQPSTLSIPFQSLNWSSIDLNLHHNDSQSIFDQFGIDTSIVNVLKHAPYYLCLTYICFRLTYLVIISFLCCNNEINSIKKPKKHIYHEPTFSTNKILSIEHRYVRHLLQKPHRNSLKNNKIKSLLHAIYRPNEHFHYSKQILNIYIIAFMLIYYLTFNLLQNGFDLIEKVYNFTLIPLLVLYDELDLPEAKVFNLKYEMMIACFLTAIIYFVQLLFGMKNYQRHMLEAYRGIFIDIPSRSAFKNARLMSKNIHYPGYCIAYLTVGYMVISNLLLFGLIVLRVLFKHLFLVEEIAKIVLPILGIYLTKLVIQWFFSRAFFLQKHGTTMVLKNLRVYFLFVYFNFFFDCFLGIISCAFRIPKAWLATFVFLPRLDYCLFGRPLEKMDSGFISYASFIHMECLHTHPVLVYFCSIVNEQINKRYQYLQTSKRDIYLYTNHQQIVFRWWLAITLSRNKRLIQLRKHRTMHFDSTANNFLERKLFNHCQNEERFDSNTVIRNHTTTCTTLLLDVDEQDERKPSY